MALIILIVTISILAFLVFIKYVEKTKENFISNMKKKQENFSNVSIKNVHSDTGELDNEGNQVSADNSEDNSTDNTLGNSENVENTLGNSENNENAKSNSGVLNNDGTIKNESQCDSNSNDDCLFGCDDNGVGKYSKDEPVKPANLEDMMKTFEETEKICEAIEKKDKERRTIEEVENLEKQLQLNRKFLIQQKAQNKQIEDLQSLVKKLQFDEDMKKVAVEKCSGKADDCLSDKEREMSKILKSRAQRKQNMNVNVNMDFFGEEFRKKLMSSLKLPENELNKVLAALQNGDIQLSELLGGSMNINTNEQNKNKLNEKGYDSSCPNCKVNLDDYIDKCKIPCKDCRDPAWKCPQDVGKK